MAIKKIRYAVVGLGHIAQIAVLPAFKHAKAKTVLTALVTGTPKKAKLVAKKYGVEHVYSYEEYDQLLSSGLVDAVYIALPNSQHLDFTLRALNVGIHVLCEKPLALSTRDCEKMITASEKSGAKLMTAYRLHFDKPNQDAIRLCRSGKLGKLKTFVSSFSYVIKDKQNIRLRPEEGSGPLWDIGIYCINASRYLFHENPVEVFAFAPRMEEGPFAKVDETSNVLMRFSGDRTALFTCSFNTATSAYYEVYGDKGMLRLQNAYEYAVPPELHVQIGEKKTKKKYTKVDQFSAELTYFADCILKNKVVEPSGAEGLTDVAIIQAIDDSVRWGTPVRVSYAHDEHAAAPVPTMVRRDPPVTKPELIGVKSASGD